MQPRPRTMHDRFPTRPSLRHVLSALLLLSLLLFLCASFLRASTPAHPDTTTTPTLLRALSTRASEYTVVSDAVVYDRYARVYSRAVRFPDGRQFDFDVWGRVWRNDSFAVVTVVPFDRVTRTFTLVREYNIAHAQFAYVFPTGQMERAKHTSNLVAAAAELEEEAQLRCGEWSNLLQGEERGAPQDKYQREEVFYYLCTDASHVQDAAKGDEEEDIDVVHGVTPRQLRDLVEAGAMQSNQIAASLLALDKLRALRLLPYSA